ncbi:GAF and ANTAR domain-containing protein [Pseudonocardia sp. GCM10023141]|uniref:GAF and ANTAR domain-containing protein n=1 Tax=Pseudonocardia sp. GCM10023141 TaxID=3252653 RepID=UPI00360CEFA8
MPRIGDVTRALMAIDRHVLDERDLAARICRACVDGLDVDGAALSLLTSTPARLTLWATDATADMIEDMQFTLNEGACMEAAETGRPVFVPDLEHGTESAQWPMFAASVLERTDVRALFVLPLQWGAVNLGVLDLYRSRPGPLSTDAMRDAIGVADAASLMLLTLRTDPGDDGWLDRSTDSRVEIHQATGMVLQQLGASVEVALARMRGYAFTEQRLLIDVARDVIARRLDFGEDMG